MPTISEPTWQDRRERIEQAVKDFVEAKPLSIDDSVDVLTARLFGLRLRGTVLKTEVRLAEMQKIEYRAKHKIRVPA